MRPRPLLVGALGCALLVPAAAGLPLAAATGAAPAPPAAAAGQSPPGLPEVSTGERPGPPVLYAPPPRAPQLQNRHPRLRAAPLLVSGTEAYVDGEFLHQDYLYDDYGADTDGRRGGSLSARSGDVDYPADPSLKGHGADLVEVRIVPGEQDVVYRFTLGTLTRPDAAIVAVALDTDRDASTGSAVLPRDPGAPFPGTDEVLTVWGSGAEHARLDGGAAVATAVEVTADVEAAQLTVTVPRSVSDPRGTWRTTVVAGVHDGQGGWHLPAGAPNGIYNVAFRYDEPVQGTNTPPDQAQSVALAADAPTRYARDVDFAALDRREDRSTVPATGRQVRLYPSRLDLGGGRDLSRFPQYRGQLQPYAVYVPSTYVPGTPTPLTLSLHSLGQQYWQYQGGLLFAQQGEQRGNVVLSPMGRGPDGWYQAEAEVDVFEAWNDLARHVRLDPERTYVSGYSMGGYGTYRLAGLYPDLFARAFTVVGPPGEGIWVPPAGPTGGADTLSNRWLENLRHVPTMNLAGLEDELVPYVGPRAQNLGAPELGVRGLEQLGYEYRFLTFPAAEHFTLALLGYDLPMARDWLGDARVRRDPSRVTFAYVPASDDRDLGLVHDHAYWVSQVEPTGAKGVVDAVSHADGQLEPATTGVRGGGAVPLPYVEVGRTRLPATVVAGRNELDLTLNGVRSVTVDLARSGLGVSEPLRVDATSDTAGELVLTGRDLTPGTDVLRDGVPLEGVRASAGRLVVPLEAGSGTYTVQR